jgi:hypothetical protein
MFPRRTMHDVQVTIAVHIGNAEAFPPLSGCGQAFVETGKAQYRAGYGSSVVRRNQAGHARSGLASQVRIRLTRAASDKCSNGQTCACQALVFQALVYQRCPSEDLRNNVAR